MAKVELVKTRPTCKFLTYCRVFRPLLCITPSKRLTYPATWHALLGVWRKPSMALQKAAEIPALEGEAAEGETKIHERFNPAPSGSSGYIVGKGGGHARGRGEGGAGTAGYAVDETNHPNNYYIGLIGRGDLGGVTRCMRAQCGITTWRFSFKFWRFANRRRSVKRSTGRARELAAPSTPPVLPPPSLPRVIVGCLKDGRKHWVIRGYLKGICKPCDSA